MNQTRKVSGVTQQKSVLFRCLVIKGSSPGINEICVQNTILFKCVKRIEFEESNFAALQTVAFSQLIFVGTRSDTDKQTEKFDWMQFVSPPVHLTGSSTVCLCCFTESFFLPYNNFGDALFNPFKNAGYMKCSSEITILVQNSLFFNYYHSFSINSRYLL